MNLKAIPKDKLQKVILVGIVSVAAIGAVLNFYVLGAMSKLRAERAKITELNQKIDQVQQEMKRTALTPEGRESLRAFVEAQQTKMVSGDPFSWVVRELTLLAEKHPIKLVGMSPGNKLPHPEKSRFNLYLTRLEVQGTYDQLGQFICALENTFPAGHLRNVMILDVDGGQGQCRATFDLALLQKPDDDKAAAKPMVKDA